MGYHRAGFDEIVGVDCVQQPRYPFQFVQGDALEYVAKHGHEFDAIHASPPCQGYSRMRHLPWLKGKIYPLLIGPTRAALQATGLPFVIENVEDAWQDMSGAFRLCGAQFGLRVYRHRLFEANFLVMVPQHQKHEHVIGSGRMLNDRAKPSESGWCSHVGKSGAAGAAAMGINWMSPDELSQAVPPAFTEYIGREMLSHCNTTKRCTRPATASLVVPPRYAYAGG